MIIDWHTHVWLPEHLGPLAQRQARRLPRVLGVKLVGVDAEAEVALEDLGLQLEALAQAPGRIAEVAAAGGDVGELRLDTLRVLIPGLHRREEVGEIPAVLRPLG